MLFIYLAFFLPIVQSSRNLICSISQKEYQTNHANSIKKKWKEQIDKENITNLKCEQVTPSL